MFLRGLVGDLPDKNIHSWQDPRYSPRFHGPTLIIGLDVSPETNKPERALVYIEGALDAAVTSCSNLVAKEEYLGPGASQSQANRWLVENGPKELENESKCEGD